MKKYKQEEDEVVRCRKVREELDREYGTVENAFRILRARAHERTSRGSATRVKRAAKTRPAPRARIKTH